MRKLCLIIFLTVSAAFYLPAGTLSRAEGNLDTPVKGLFPPEVVKELPNPVLVDPCGGPKVTPHGISYPRLFIYYIRKYGWVLSLYGFDSVYSYTLTNLTTGQTQSSGSLMLRFQEDLFIPVAEEGDYLLSIRTRDGIYEGYFTIDFYQLRQEQMNQFLGGF